jgi:hypothetical protein
MSLKIKNQLKNLPKRPFLKRHLIDNDNIKFEEIDKWIPDLKNNISEIFQSLNEENGTNFYEHFPLRFVVKELETLVMDALKARQIEGGQGQGQGYDQYNPHEWLIKDMEIDARLVLNGYMEYLDECQLLSGDKMAPLIWKSCDILRLWTTDNALNMNGGVCDGNIIQRDKDNLIHYINTLDSRVSLDERERQILQDSRKILNAIPV